jgi:hypothetical protein
MTLSLSNFFPEGTEYFYSFPSGEDSLFFNHVPAWKEELVAARPLVCAGPNIKVVTFSATNNPSTISLLQELGVPLIEEKQRLVLPPSIDANVYGKRRNVMVRHALRNIATSGRLVMAQPLLDEGLKDKYQISPELIVWLNDKKNMSTYISSEFLPRRFLFFSDGLSFFSSMKPIPIPCVVKVSSSSSGDGVRICKTFAALQAAKYRFRAIRGTIFIEEYIASSHNIGIQFGIPWEVKKPIEILGINEQIVTPQGEYLGAMIRRSSMLPEVSAIRQTLLTRILPYVREKGWYGIGGLDVLIDAKQKFYFIDSNFRMTAVSPYLSLIQNGKIRKSMATFTGSWRWSKDGFLATVVPMAREDMIKIITLTEHRDGFHFNAALLFDEVQEISRQAKALLTQGIDAVVLRRLASGKAIFT